MSGDTLGAALIRSFKQLGIEAEFEGIGGPQMIAEGFQSHYAMETLSVMGIVEVLKDIKKLFAVRDGLVERWSENPVDVFIGIDAPDFNLRLSKQLKLKKLAIKTVQYVSPSVWAWRQKRVFSIKASIDLVLCLFPFEKKFYEQYDVPAEFVGHPLARSLPLENSIVEAKQGLGLDPTKTYVSLLPGSRGGEVERLLPVLLDSAGLLYNEYPAIEYLIPAINTARLNQIQQHLATLPEHLKHKVHVLHSNTDSKIGRSVMDASDAIALASGTATLEGMLLHRPMVAIYKLHWLTYFIASFMVKIPYYSLPNIIAGEKVIEELIQKDATPSKIAAELKRLLHPVAAQAQVIEHRRMHQELIDGDTVDPAKAILEHFKLISERDNI